MMVYVQIGIVAVLFGTVSLWLWAQLSHRKAGGWDEIVAQLRTNGWGFEQISDGYLFKSGIRATDRDIWTRIDGANGLLCMFRNAALLLQLADYAGQHGEAVDEALIEQLRADAFAIRMSVVKALAKYALAKSTVGASVNAYRAAAMYSDMLVRTTTLFQEHAANLFPRYLEAM